MQSIEEKNIPWSNSSDEESDSEEIVDIPKNKMETKLYVKGEEPQDIVDNPENKKKLIYKTNSGLAAITLVLSSMWFLGSGINSMESYNNACPSIKALTSTVLFTNLLVLGSSILNVLSFRANTKMTFIFSLISSIGVFALLITNLTAFLPGSKYMNSMLHCNLSQNSVSVRAMLLGIVLQICLIVFLIYYSAWLFTKLNAPILTDKHQPLLKKVIQDCKPNQKSFASRRTAANSFA